MNDDIYEVKKSDIYQFLTGKIFIAHRVYSKHKDVVILADSAAEAEAKAREFFGIAEESNEKVIIRPARKSERPDVLIFY